MSSRPGAQCHLCRKLYGKNRGIRSPEYRRKRLKPSPDALPRVTVVEHSNNAKLGGMPATLSTAETCPDACSFKGHGCFAEFHLLGHHWGNVARDGLTWAEFMEWVWAIPEKTLWRHNEAGDLPGAGDTLDVSALNELVDYAVAGGSLGMTYTHKPLATDAERAAIRRANDLGFTVNLSANSLDHADDLASLGVGPVTVVVRDGTRTGDRTPAGRRLVVCPAQTQAKLTCNRCGICWWPNRKGIVAFIAHGQGKRLLPLAPAAPAEVRYDAAAE